MTVTVYATDSREFASRYDTEPALWRFRRAVPCAGSPTLAFGTRQRLPAIGSLRQARRIRGER